MSTVNETEVYRQVVATNRRELYKLPASWYEPKVAERMSEWIKRNKAK